MIEEFYYKPIFVPPFSIFVYVYCIFWILLQNCKKSKRMSPEISMNAIVGDTSSEKQKQNLISNWTNRFDFHGKHLIICFKFQLTNLYNSQRSKI